MVNRNYLKCTICETKTITRTAIGHGTYQEFAFPCPNCGVEIRFGMELDQKNASFEYTKLMNAVWIASDDSIPHIEVFDAENLNPVKKNEHFSPFMATVWLPKDTLMFRRHSAIRYHAISFVWPLIEQLIIHSQRQQWQLFDNAYKNLGNKKTLHSNNNRIKAVYEALEQYSRLFIPINLVSRQRIRQRIAFAKSSCPSEMENLVSYFRSKYKDKAIDEQLYSLRKQWTGIYEIIAPVYVSLYWDESKNQLTEYTLAQKRFDELKNYFVDCFETLCRISTIATVIETIIFKKQAAVMKSKGIISIENYDTMNNGSKPNILKKLVVADLFVPYMDYKLRNGIGHHSAKYDVTRDTIEYLVENKKGMRQHSICYILFCEKLMKTYIQLEIISLYSNWLNLASQGIEW